MVLAVYQNEGISRCCRGKSLVRAFSAHTAGPKGTGVRGMRVCKGNTVLLTGGADGVVQRFDVADGDLQARGCVGCVMTLRCI